MPERLKLMTLSLTVMLVFLGDMFPGCGAKRPISPGNTENKPANSTNAVGRTTQPDKNL